MPFRRSTRARKVRPRRGRRVRRGLARRGKKMSVYSQMKPHFFKSTAVINNAISTNVVGSTGGGNSQSINFQTDDWYLSTGNGNVNSITYYSIGFNATLDMLPGYAALVSQFDQYRLVGIKTKIRSFTTQSYAQDGTTLTNQVLSGMWHDVIDYDDAVQAAASAAGVQTLREYPTYKTRNVFGTHTRYWRPKIKTTVLTDGAALQASASGSPWLDCGSPNIPYFGYKAIVMLFCPAPATPSYVWFMPEVTVYMEFRGSR